MITARNGGSGDTFIRWLALPLMCVVVSSTSSAHQLDEYLQGTIIGIEPDAITLEINLTPGVKIVDKVLEVIDLDHDGVISTNEVAGYAETLKRDLTVRLDGKELVLKVDAFAVADAAEVRTGWGIILLDFSAKNLALAPGAHRLTFENRHFPAISAYLLNAARPRSSLVQISGQKRNEKQSSGEIDFEIISAPRAAARSGGLGWLGLLLVVAVGAVAFKWKQQRKVVA